MTEDFYDDMQKITRRCVKSDNIDLNCGGDDLQDVIDRLAEYEIAEEEGRLVVLPCKVGDAVYTIDDKYYEYQYHKGVQKGHVCRFEYDKQWFIWIHIDGCNKDLQIAYKINDFNKIVFLTREKAEKALRDKMDFHI